MPRSVEKQVIRLDSVPSALSAKLPAPGPGELRMAPGESRGLRSRGAPIVGGPAICEAGHEPNLIVVERYGNKSDTVDGQDRGGTVAGTDESFGYTERPASFQAGCGRVERHACNGAGLFRR